MFSIEEVRKNNRTSLLVSSFAAHFAAMALVLMMVLGSSTAVGEAPNPTTPTPETTHTPPVFPRDGARDLHCFGGVGPGQFHFGRLQLLSFGS